MGIVSSHTVGIGIILDEYLLVIRSTHDVRRPSRQLMLQYGYRVGTYRGREMRIIRLGVRLRAPETRTGWRFSFIGESSKKLPTYI